MTHAQPWLVWPLGAKVVVRRRLAEGGYSDSVGPLLAADDDAVTVRTKRGDITIPAADIAIGKIVGPPRPRRSYPPPPGGGSGLAGGSQT